MQEKVNCRCKIFLNFMISEIKYKRNFITKYLIELSIGVLY